MSKPNFVITLNKGGKKLSATTHKDTRNFVERVFTNFDAQTGLIKNKEVVAYNTEDCTPSEAGVPYEERAGKIQYFMNYKNNVKDFTSSTKGQDLVILTLRQSFGKGGGSTLMIPIDDIEEFSKQLVALKDVIKASLAEGEAPVALAASDTPVKDPENLDA